MPNVTPSQPKRQRPPGKGGKATTRKPNGEAPPVNGEAAKESVFTPPELQPPPSGASAELFQDLKRVREENAMAVVDLVKQAVAVEVRRPENDEFVMLSKVADHCLPAFLHEDPIVGECYVPLSTIKAGWLGGRERPVQLRVYVTQPGEERLWPIPMPRPGMKENSYNSAQRDRATEMLQRDPQLWASIRSNTIARTYSITWAGGDLGKPKFTGRDMETMLKSAFGRDGIIDRFEHPALKRLRGEPT